jgi:hypothetical protein
VKHREICKAQIMRLSGTGGFPNPAENREALKELIDTMEAVTSTEAEARRIVDECLQSSRFCPAPFDLRNVALGLEAKDTSWTPDIRTCPAKLCDGHGWAQTFFLITEERHGEATYKRRERITRDQYAALAGKVDNRKQRVYEGVEPCACSPRASSPEAA